MDSHKYNIYFQHILSVWDLWTSKPRLVTPKLTPISLVLPTFFPWTKTCAIDGPIIFVGSKHSCWELGYALTQFHKNFFDWSIYDCNKLYVWIVGVCSLDLKVGLMLALIKLVMGWANQLNTQGPT